MADYDVTPCKQNRNNCDNDFQSRSNYMRYALWKKSRFMSVSANCTGRHGSILLNIFKLSMSQTAILDNYFVGGPTRFNVWTYA